MHVSSPGCANRPVEATEAHNSVAFEELAVVIAIAVDEEVLLCVVLAVISVQLFAYLGNTNATNLRT